MTDEKSPRDRQRSLSPSAFVRALRDEEAARVAASPVSRVTIGIATTVGAALLIAVAGGIANFLVMRSEVSMLRTDLASHTAREGHEATLRRQDRLEARFESLGASESQRAIDLNRRLLSLENTVNDIRDDQQEILRSLPVSWRRAREPTPPRR